jgi:putative effector of murein hydrolase LrgA (UPF0299 family)
MLAAFAILLIFQCLGEGVAFLTGVPIPGPVIGMLLLFAALLAWPRLHETLEATAAGLLSHLSLLFVPAGAGVVVAAASGSGQWFAILAAVAGSSLLALGVTALVMQAMSRVGKGDGDA